MPAITRLSVMIIGILLKKSRSAILSRIAQKKDSDKIKGIVQLDEERLYNHWFFAKTTKNTFILNYALSKRLYGNENHEASEDSMLDLRDDIKENGPLWHQNLCDDFDKTLYLNFRYTQSATVNADKSHIYKAYASDSFYKQHYRNLFFRDESRNRNALL